MGKNVYRFAGSLLVAVICQCAVTLAMGGKEITVLRIVPMILATFLLALWCQLHVKGRVLLGGTVAIVVVVTRQVLGDTQLTELAELYEKSLQAAAIGVACFFLNLLLEKLFSAKAAVAAGLLIWVLVDLFTVRQLFQLGVAAISLYVVIVYIEWTQRGWKKEKTNKRHPYVVWILPFLLVYFVLMMEMPVSEKPYDWQFVKNAYADLKEAFLKASSTWYIGGRDDFDGGISGFSEEGRLYGGFTKESREVLTVQGQQNIKTNVYLIGKIYDTFHGRQWEQTSESASKDRVLDTLETLYAARMYDEGREERYVQMSGVNVRYQYLATKYLFAPLKSLCVEGDDSEHTSVGGNLVFDKTMGYGTGYSASFVQINVDHPLFYELLDAPPGEDEAAFAEVQETFKDFLTERYTLADLQVHREEIEAVYGKEVEPSEEVRRWLDEVTAEADTDIEKLKAIEAKLQALTYSTNPGKLPEWIDTEEEFLDYFLLESKQGFCSYFATAFVLLARAEGIPARYVEGFCVPVEGPRKMVVYSDASHAWPEVYCAGSGWIPFEPTPGYAEIRYTPWKIKDAEEENKKVGLGSMEEDETEEFIPEVMPQKPIEEEEPEKEEDSENLLKILFYTVSSVVVAGVLVFTADAYLKKRRYRKWDLRKQFIAEVNKNLKMLAFLGYERRENETLEELGVRAWSIMSADESLQRPALQFLTLYEEALYGNHPVDEGMKNAVLKEREYLFDMLKKWKRLAYVYCKISYR